jgi:hypothetical protein
VRVSAAVLLALVAIARPAAGANEEEISTPHPAAAEAPASSPHPIAAIENAPAPAPALAGLSGFLTTTGAATDIPGTIPSHMVAYTLQGAAGASASGTLPANVEYTAYIIVGVSAGNLTPTGASVAPEQITVGYTPIEGFSFHAGYMRIPFSVAQSSVITQSMFPNRPGPTELFQSGADSGFMAGYDHPGGYVRARIGAFDGSSLGLTVPDHVTRGPVFSTFVDVAPFGAMPPLEGDPERGKFRMAMGAGALYRGANVYDTTGYDALHIRNIRLAGALRIAWAGVFVQGELLRSIQTDDKSDRVAAATGTYAQGSYYVPVTANVAIAPIARIGLSIRDQDFFPRRVVSFDSGLALYPHAELQRPGALRIVAEYDSERRIDEGETAYGALISGLLAF